MRRIEEQIKETPARIWFLLMTLWVSMMCIGIVASTVRHAQQIEHEFLGQSQALYETVRQRLDQNEAVLSGIEALFRTFPDLGFDGIRGYAHAMLARYPHIYTVGLQPRVALHDVPTFEAKASKSIHKGYRIRDFGLDGEREWRPAAARPAYYPVTFMEPPVAEASPVLGFDVYSDPKLRVAIDASITSGKSEASAPFPLVEGGRGYVFFKALSANTTEPAANLVSLLISASKLVSQNEFPRGNIAVNIYRSNYNDDDPLGQLLLRPAGKHHSSWEEAIFPHYSFEKSFTTNQQPFVLSTSISPAWEVFDPPALAGIFVIVSGVCVLLLVIYSMKQQRLTEEREAASRLQQERVRAQVTLASISDAVIRVNLCGEIEYLNESAERALRRPGHDLLGEEVQFAVPLAVTLATESIDHPVVQCLTDGKEHDLPDNATLIFSDGGATLIEGSVSPLFDENTGINGAVLTFRDMGPVRQRALAALEASETRLRQHQVELAHVARLNTMGEMASGIAHELNQPLNAILNYNQACLRMLADEKPNFDEIGRAMAQSAAQSKRAGEIIKALRAFVSKHGATSVPLQLEQVTRNTLVLAECELHDNQTQIIQTFPNTLPEVMADSIQIEQVILNLLRNSIDAMRELPVEQRLVEITGSETDSSVIISVRDHGYGISEQMMEHLFHPFQTTKAHGMGLGLTICHSIIESYGGRFSAENHQGGGAILSFLLPINKAQKP